MPNKKTEDGWDWKDQVLKKYQAIYKASYSGYIGEAIYVNTNITEFIYEKPEWIKDVYIDVNKTWSVAKLRSLRKITQSYS